jgi:hypothetical protein
MSVKRIIMALAMTPVGLTGVFGIGKGLSPGRLATIGLLYLTGSIAALVVVLRFEEKRLDHEYKVLQLQVPFLANVTARRLEQLLRRGSVLDLESLRSSGRERQRSREDGGTQPDPISVSLGSLAALQQRPGRRSPEQN